MPKFQVIVTQDTTESTFVTVEAASEEEAAEKATTLADKFPLSKWERDECANSDPYVTGCDPEEDDDA